MTQIKRAGIVMYFDMRPVVEKLSDHEAKELLLAILDYGENGVMPEFRSATLECCWPLLASRMDADRERYRQRVESNRRAARARWAAHLAEDMETETECTGMQTDAI